MSRNGLVPSSNGLFKKNENIKYPGDKITQEMTPCGNIVTRLNTKERKATHRQYTKKDGTLGKQTMTIMQPDN